MKPLKQVSAANVGALTSALRDALEGGPAVWPSPAARSASGDVGEIGEVDDRVALVVETSGSTDAPKRVALSADALIASAEATHDALGGPGQWLLAVPAHYIAGAQVLVRGILAGTEPESPGGEHFDAYEFATASARLAPHVPHYTSLVPVQLARLVEGAERDAFIAAAMRSFDAVLVGGQALAPDVGSRAAELGANVVRTYGSSETSGGCVYDGRPIGDARVRIEDGVVELAGPILADGYLGDPERTAAAFTTDPRGTRWYRTGDLGELSADGVLRIRGRADDVIISGGVKVALGEIERAVRGVPGFAEAVVMRVADDEWGERAVVIASQPAAATSDALVALAAATDAAGLTPAARPVRVHVVERMPLLASGKPDRRALEALAASPR